MGSDPGFYALFFPLSGKVDICGKHVEPGEYIQANGPESINTELDFFTVLVRTTDLQ